MIAGTITPFALLVIKPVKPVLGWVIFAVAWVVVATMIPLTLTIFGKTTGIDVVMYLALGWLIIISIKTLWEVFSRTGVIFLISGGIAYTLGVILYGIGSKKRYFHTVFHFFIIIGSILHFLAIYVCACISGQEANRKAKSSGKGKVLAARLFIFLQCRILC